MVTEFKHNDTGRLNDAWLTNYLEQHHANKTPIIEAGYFHIDELQGISRNTLYYGKLPNNTGFSLVQYHDQKTVKSSPLNSENNQLFSCIDVDYELDYMALSENSKKYAVINGELLRYGNGQYFTDPPDQPFQIKTLPLQTDDGKTITSNKGIVTDNEGTEYEILNAYTVYRYYNGIPEFIAVPTSETSVFKLFKIRLT